MKVKITHTLTRDFLINLCIRVIPTEDIIDNRMFFTGPKGNDVVVDPENFDIGTSEVINKEFRSINDAKMWSGDILIELCASVKKIKKMKSKLPEPVIFDIDGTNIKKID